MPASNMRIKDYREYRLLTQYSWLLYGTHHSVLGMIRLMHTVIKKNDIAHYFTTRPFPAKAENGLVAMLKVKGYSLWIKHPPGCIEQRPRPLPFMVYTAQHRVLICMSPLPARAGSDLLQYNLQVPGHSHVVHGSCLAPWLA